MANKFKNLIDYVNDYGDQTFWDRPFNDVDSLVLSELCYINLDDSPFLKIPNFNCTFQELIDLVGDDHLSREMWGSSKSQKLLNAVSKSRRFANVVIFDCHQMTDVSEEEQFFAMAFRLNTDNGYIDYIAYRGTDNTLIGWKESLNMSFKKDLPSQVESVKYLEYISGLSDNNLMVGGHSKGGNLAVYAAIKASSAAKKRLLAVYNHDGPGFLEGTFSEDEKRSMVDKIYKTIPAGTFFGFLLEDSFIKAKVVDSNGFMILQHDALTWRINKTEFYQLEKVDKSAEYNKRTMSRWLNKMSIDERKEFFDAVYDIISESREKTERGFRLYLAKNLPKIIKDIKNSHPEIKKTIIKSLKLLAGSFGAELKASWSAFWRKLFRLDK